MAFRGESSGSRVTTHEDTEEAGQTKSLMRNHWAAATLRVLSSMPSCSLRQNRAATNTQCQQREAHSQESRASNVMELLLQDSSPEEPQRQTLLKNLMSLSAGERAHHLRNTPLSLSEKCELRVLTCPERDKAHITMKMTITCLVKTLYSGWQGVLSLLIYLHIWQGALKQVSSRFGTGVLSYFLFLRTLLLYNIFLSVIVILFLVLPQVIHGSSQSPNSISFTGFDILTGTGVLTNSLLFYGYYNYTEDKSCQQGNKSGSYMAGPYNIQLAYLLIIGIGLIVTCIALVYSVSKMLGENFQNFKSHGNIALKVFSCWDFKVSKKTSAKLQSENICTQLKELLCELGCDKPKQNALFRLHRLATHCFAWVACLGSTSCSVLAIYYMSTECKHGNSAKDDKLLEFPFLVCCVNHLLPTVFNMVACLESYDSIIVCIYVSITRNLLFKVSSMVVLCYHWLNITATQHNDCWETFVGQELYRFLLMDMVFAVLYTIFGEFVWRLISQEVLKRKRKPIFDIARNVLDLIHGQTLAWLGVLFMPLLPAIQSVKLLFLFYMKRVSLLNNCQAPRKSWRASQMSSFFMLLLWCPSFLGAAACVVYTMWRSKPSSTCGPFRTLPNMFPSVRGLSSNWLSWAYTCLVDNPLFLFITAGFFLLLIYIHTQAVDGQKRIIALLQEQIENESEDKKFLIAKLQELCDQEEHS
ncbi:transmembrane channel-like protein 6 isoform X2 [Electrophorus electricus]|uniref:transmembrane channel-like protein 6 isoform X2 n=1 Tax=Electrophorus electricus TaxID=8005 RepID=UPI0015D075D7|nr:transmembrane channel-like protein 6 isoform X2 [Electrophorus electricus]